VGEDAITTSANHSSICQAIGSNNILNVTHIVNANGEYSGILVDFYFDKDIILFAGKNTNDELYKNDCFGRLFMPMKTMGTTKPQTSAIFNSNVQNIMRTMLDTLTETKNRESRKIFIVDKIAQQTLEAPGGGQLLVIGDIVTLKVFRAAEYLEILDELYWAVGGSTITDRSNRGIKKQVSYSASRDPLRKLNQSLVKKLNKIREKSQMINSKKCWIFDWQQLT
jgi:hypothetical protein